MLKLKTHFSLSNLLNPNKSENLLKQNSNSKLKIQSAKIRSSYSKKSLTVYLDFTFFSQDTKTNKSYEIGLDANLQKARFHSIRLDGESFNIPFKFTSGGETKDFLINNSSIHDGSYFKLLRTFTNEQKEILLQSCDYFKDDKNLNNLFDNIKSDAPHKSSISYLSKS